jgi:anti-sigma factor RsiW
MTPTNSDRTRLLHYLGGDLGPAERRALKRRLAENAALRDDLHRMKRLQHTMQAADRSFAPGFADRVLDRVQPTASADIEAAAGIDAFYDALQSVFLRLALATLLLIGGVGGYNVAQFGDEANSAVEASLGLPETTLRAAAHDALVPTDE